MPNKVTETESGNAFNFGPNITSITRTFPTAQTPKQSKVREPNTYSLQPFILTTNLRLHTHSLSHGCRRSGRRRCHGDHRPIIIPNHKGERLRFRSQTRSCVGVGVGVGGTHSCSSLTSRSRWYRHSGECDGGGGGSTSGVLSGSLLGLLGFWSLPLLESPWSCWAALSSSERRYNAGSLFNCRRGYTFGC